MVKIRQDWDSTPLIQGITCAPAFWGLLQSAIARVRAMVENAA